MLHLSCSHLVTNSTIINLSHLLSCSMAWEKSRVLVVKGKIRVWLLEEKLRLCSVLRRKKMRLSAREAIRQAKRLGFCGWREILRLSLVRFLEGRNWSSVLEDESCNKSKVSALFFWWDVLLFSVHWGTKFGNSLYNLMRLWGPYVTLLFFLAITTWSSYVLAQHLFVQVIQAQDWTKIVEIGPY